MHFLIDAQLPPGLVQYLSERGHRADHVQLLWEGAPTDADVWARACEHGSVIITKDSDFIDLARRKEGAQVVWIRLGNVSSAGLQKVLERVFLEVIEALEAGERLVEIV